MAPPTRKAEALAYMAQCLGKHHHLPSPHGTSQGTGIPSSTVGRYYKLWVRDGVLDQPDDLGGVYIPGEEFYRAVKAHGVEPKHP